MALWRAEIKTETIIDAEDVMYASLVKKLKAIKVSCFLSSNSERNTKRQEENFAGMIFSEKEESFISHVATREATT